MYSISVRQLEVLVGLICIVVGVTHWVVMILVRRRPHRCRKLVQGTCVRIEHETCVSFIASDSTALRYSCVFGFDYDNNYILVKQRNSYSKAQYAIGEQVDLYINPDDLTDFWYKNKRGMAYYIMFGILYMILGVLFLRDFSLFRNILAFLFEVNE